MLDFGVSLEEVFPEDRIQHEIKNYLLDAFNRISYSNVSVQEVLRKFQGSIEERLVLKHRLILGRNISKLKIFPGAILWVVRHFIGLLPIPLFPERNNKGDYLWTEIINLCKTSVINYATRGRYNTELVKLIAKKLSTLPQQSITLIVNLFDTMRMLAVLPEGEPKINKVSAFALVEYFSSSLFIRPFHPGSTDKTAKQYYPLTLFLILKWTEIKDSCLQLRRQNNSIVHSYQKRQFVRRSTVYNADPNLPDVEMRLDPPCTYLQDVACQTDDVSTKLQKNCLKKCCCGILKTHEEKQRSETKIIYIKKKCCCTYDSNYESVLLPEDFSISEEERISSDLPKSRFECTQKSSTVLFTGVNNKIYPKIPYDKIQHFDPIEKEVPCDTIKSKMAKVGWSYISNCPVDDLNESGSKHNSVESLSNIGWNLKSETSDSLESMRKLLNTELKEKFTQNEDEKRISKEFSDPTCSSIHSLPKSLGSVSKDSRISVNKIKNKFNILKAFSDKKNSSKKSLTCGLKRAESKIKYKRIGSENSIDQC